MSATKSKWHACSLWHHFSEILVIGFTGNCHFENIQWNQWWKFHQNYNLYVSLFIPGSHFLVLSWYQNILLPLSKMNAILHTFSNKFPWMKTPYLIEISRKFTHKGPISRKSTMVEVMPALGAVRWQAITWTNVDQNLGCHMSSLGHSELYLIFAYNCSP